MSDAPRYPDTDGKSLDNQVRELKDYIINLHRYIRYALNNIDVRNMTLSTAASVRKVGDIDSSVSEIIQDVDRISLSVTTKDGKVSLALNGAGGGEGTIDLTGMVTFSNLETSGQTVINADNITTGKITAVDIEGVNITGSKISSTGDLGTLNIEGSLIESVSGDISLRICGGNIYIYKGSECISYISPMVARDTFDLEINSTDGISVYASNLVGIHSGKDILISSQNTGDISLLTESGRILLNGAEPFTKSSVIPLANGGTGAATPSGAANNLCEVGTWTPVLINESGSAPRYTTGWSLAYYIKIGKLVFISVDMAVGISNKGGSHAKISGLPYTCGSVMCALNSNETYQIIDMASGDLKATFRVMANTKTIRILTPNGSGSYSWKVNTSAGTNAGRLRFSGVYGTDI